MLPPITKARKIKVDLQLAINDFLRAHGKPDDYFALEPHDRILRQKSLPADAKVLSARLEEDDAATNQLLRDAKELIGNLRGGLIVTDADIAGLSARIDAEVARPPARNLIVVVESARWKAVRSGDEPWHTAEFDYAAFFPPQQEGAR